ncbi:hypothetical protein ADL22_17960 [Streptomyces sp. NRRL F-4489]|uniref:hypothetical protein n=1 Tax=Streptomyces sp. NRRL F-4489 TaxID=1609095 RepID=UPI00074A683F|nr:hypothetical protein [Streptomyces sp. NRRL F-4489]KUL38527.1 hypothetical protein ADL22_17960 [Streptomyces sp. NRRL F-4489]
MGLMEGNGYQLEPEAFEQLTKGIKAATSELKELGFDIEAQLGRGFDRLSLDAVECGDDGLAEIFSSFCERWGWGVYHLMQDANGFSKRLGITAGLYYEQEQYGSDILKQAANAALGDPTKSAEELHRTSWNGIKNDIGNTFTPDWDPNSQASRESYQRTYDAAREFGHDVTSVPDRLMNGGKDPSETEAELEGPGQRHGGSDK